MPTSCFLKLAKENCVLGQQSQDVDEWDKSHSIKCGVTLFLLGLARPLYLGLLLGPLVRPFF